MTYYESEVVELKEKLSDSFEKEVVGILNTLGGTIYLGVKDDGSILGVDDVDEVVLKASDRICNNILPSPRRLFSIKILKENDKKLIVISIGGGLEKPYYLKKYGMTSKGCFIRQGTQTSPMPLNKIESSFSRRVINTLHNVVSPNQKLTFTQLKIYYQSKGYDVDSEYFLDNLNLYTDDGKYNYAAYLMADNNGNSIKVARFGGKDKLDIIERNEYGRCCLIKSTYAVLSKLDIINSVVVRVGETANRKEFPLVDKSALKEAVINAIIHNDYLNGSYPVFEIYDDRIEVVSSGGLPQGLSKEEFFKGRSLPRNKELMRIFSDMELSEQLGSGMKKIMTFCKRDDFDISENFVSVIFRYSKKALSILDKSYKYKRDEVFNDINENISGEVKLKEKLLVIIAQNPYINRKEISQILNVSLSTIDRLIKELKSTGTILGKTKNRNGKWILSINRV